MPSGFNGYNYTIRKQNENTMNTQGFIFTTHRCKMTQNTIRILIQPEELKKHN